ncbi:hypothetical protein KC845_01745 [Candidatus Kaiserbacteria bacterium]|nr:hypothetical protein [Candidatus Kaiserbacteria bacterium]
MMIRFILSVIVLLLGLGPTVVGAVSNDFTVRTLVGSDNMSPTVPSPVTATPIAQTQIDITWGASSDNVGVVGYQLFRDLVQIATTSLTTYSDIGLTASTTYSYTVVAFDASNNFSSSSVAVSTTTYAVPVVPPDNDPASSTVSNSTKVSLKLDSFLITLSTNGANFEFTTNLPAQFVLRYGKNSSYDEAILKGEVFQKKHSTSLLQLESATDYKYELFGYDRFGKEFLLKSGYFKTNSLPDTEAPTNVSNFKTTALDDDVLLSWDNPTDDDFAYVRILRNHHFFPVDPYDGFLVYEGTKAEFLDEGALNSEEVQYYTIYTYDSNGNYSSGAISMVRKAGFGFIPTEVSTTTSSTSNSGRSDIKATFSDVEIWQNNVLNKMTKGELSAKALEPLTLRIPYDLFPQRLKVITVTLTHPLDQTKTFSFLMRATEDFLYYEARLAPLTDLGLYGVSFTIFDVNTNELVTFDGGLRLLGAEDGGLTALNTIDIGRWYYWFMFVLILASLMIFIMILLKRRNDGEDKIPLENT